MSDIINIKGTRNGLVIFLDSSHDFDDIKKTLNSKIESARGFFNGAKFTFRLNDALTAERTKELEEICCGHGLVPDAKITWGPSRETANNLPGAKEFSHEESSREKAMADNVRPLMREASPSLPAVGLTEADKKPCLLINQNIRSGKKINYNGNVVIFGDVNPGSEITAAGDVIIMGSLRGVVHAGANGDEASVIMAYRLNPVQLRIATTITRPPENNQVSTFPEIARLRQGQMIIEPYQTSGCK
ncbi:MAG: septum site-determining protein MinC [Thermincola sp.]|jgi:septum site-determining protein MinC|nr:septum site-determining protein MinC [Thermincola sp.]MDT3701445.1 septum site-determining protein MinC [Thermincola sp.]